MRENNTNSSFPAYDDGKVRTNWKTLGVVVGFLLLGFGSYVLLRADVQEHGKRIDAVESRVATDHEILIEIRSYMKAASERPRADGSR